MANDLEFKIKITAKDKGKNCDLELLLDAIRELYRYQRRKIKEAPTKELQCEMAVKFYDALVEAVGDKRCAKDAYWDAGLGCCVAY